MCDICFGNIIMTELILLLENRGFQACLHEALLHLEFRLVCSSLKVCRINKLLEIRFEALFRGDFSSLPYQTLLPSLYHWLQKHWYMWLIKHFVIFFFYGLGVTAFILRVNYDSSWWKINANLLMKIWLEYDICSIWCRSGAYCETAPGFEVH